MPMGTIELSAPPATMTSASSMAIIRAASPMAWAPVAQAVTTEWFGPLRPWRMEIWPEARLISDIGMKKGLTRRGPCSFSTRAVSAMGPRPPMPEPTMTPVRSWSSPLSGFQPASARASSAAAMA